MYESGKKRFNKKGTRQSPTHPMHGTPRILIVASKHPKNVEQNNEQEESQDDEQ